MNRTLRFYALVIAVAFAVPAAAQDAGKAARAAANKELLTL